MNHLKPVTIIGGGLAGLTLGIGLRGLQVPVTLWEAGHYPRHRVCGEFISGRGQEVLGRLGLLAHFRRAGAILSRTAGFFFGQVKSPVRPVNPPALCLSRFTMDQLLAELFQNAGGDLRQNQRWSGDHEAEAIVMASGRRAQTVDHGWKWFGLKLHARKVDLEADLEMHGFEHGYVGLCRLPAGEVNVCGLFRTRTGSAARPAMDLLRGALGTPWHCRLANAEFEETSFCSIAGLALTPAKASAQADCRLGDALTMIPPVTGNGMSMAFEAAELALEPIAAYSRGEISWNKAKNTIAQACDASFRQRLLWAKWLHKMMFSPLLRTRLGKPILGSGCIWNLMFSRTR